jgi:RHS repeat-associated protein
MKVIGKEAAGGLQNKFKYNGKEEQSKEFSDGTGLDYLDYGARMYDAQIGRWGVIDPLSESYTLISPFVYTINNPINGIDPTGRDVIFINASKAVPAGITTLGHGAVIIGNSVDGWKYYSINGVVNSSSPYGDSKNADVETNLGYVDNTDQIVQKANTVNPNEKHEYDRYVRIKTTPEEDKLMMKKATDVSSSKKYIFIGSSCLDVQKSVYSVIADCRFPLSSLLIQGPLREVIPNRWIQLLPSAFNTMNFFTSIFGGQQITAPTHKKTNIIIGALDKGEFLENE